MSIFSELFNKKKPKAGRVVAPSFLRTTSTNSTIADDRTDYTNTDLTTLRDQTDTQTVAREYGRVNADFSHSIENFIRFIVTDSYTLTARSMETGEIDEEVTRLAQLFALRIDRLPTYIAGFSPQSSIASVAETVIPQLLCNGCAAAEVVLDKSYLPTHIEPISTNEVKYESTGDNYVPYITGSGDDVYLDSSAIYLMSLTPDPESPYSRSWYESAIQSILSSTEFGNDLRRAGRRATFPRVTASIDLEKTKASFTPDVQLDSEKLTAALNSTISDVESTLNGLQPEDALVYFGDIMTVEHLTSGNITAHDSVQTQNDIINSSVANGLHTLPSILGRGVSSATGSTEAVLFLKVTESLQSRLNEMFSYLFTQALRLQGHDVVVDFKYKKPSLRSESEEESFAAMRQSRILELLSTGHLSDAEASIMLTGELPSANYEPLSGTGFRANTSVVTADNPYSNTSVSGEGINSTTEQKNQSSGDTQPKTNSTTG